MRFSFYTRQRFAETFFPHLSKKYAILCVEAVTEPAAPRGSAAGSKTRPKKD